MQGGEAQLGGRRGSRSAQLLDVGRDMHALDRRELRNTLRRKPIEELDDRARIPYGSSTIHSTDWLTF